MRGTIWTNNRFGVVFAEGMDEDQQTFHQHRQIKDRHSTCNMLQDKRVCKNVDVQPQPLPVTSETWNNGRANTRNEAKVDIKPKGF